MTPPDLPDIALLGWTGAGKSTAADMLVELGYQRLAFAGRADLPHQGSPRDIVVQIWGPEALNDRNKLIAIANAARSVDPDVWLDHLVREVESRRPYPIVVDDTRFENEYWGLKGRRFVSVRITAPEFSRIDRLKANGKWLDEDYLRHPIEHFLDDTQADYVIENDGNTDDLYDALVDVLMKERRKR